MVVAGKMSGRPDILVVYPPGEVREALCIQLEARRPKCVDSAKELALGASARLVLAASDELEQTRAVVGAHRPIIAVIHACDELTAQARAEHIEASLLNGADEVLLWPSPAALLNKRVGMFLDGALGPGRVIFDPSRVTSFVHAIRNPLNVITLYAELLRMEPLGDDALGSVGRLVRAAKRVDALLGELESLLYLQVGEAPIRSQPTELGELVEIVLGELRYDISDKPLTVDLHQSPTGTLALADPDLARRAFHSVFGRVAKLALGHSVVRIRTSAAPPSVEIEAPITPVPPHKTALFRAAGTELDVRESMGGVGVGLTFAHHALKAMGAQLEHDEAEDGFARTRIIFQEHQSD